MSEKVWKKFIKDIKNLIPTIDMIVLNKLKSTFIEMPNDFYKSAKCSSLLSDTLKVIRENRLKAYIHLLDFKKSLKSIKKMKRNGPKINDGVEIKKAKLEPEDTRDVMPMENIDQVNTDESEKYVNAVTSQINEIENISESSIKIEKYIIKLENVLQATKTQIEKLEEQELSLDELDSEMSAFVMLDKLKAHYVKVWKKVSKLRNTRSNLRKRYLKSFSFSGSVYPELNKAIEDFVKLKKFPDFNDIRNLVSTYVKNNSIEMSSQKISELTVDIFTQIGNKLKKLRITEFVQYFGNHLTDQVKNENDPILFDKDLRKTLQDNHVEGEKKIDELLDKYTKLQQSISTHDKSQNSNNSEISTEYSTDSENEAQEDELLEETLLQPIENLYETETVASSTAETQNEISPDKLSVLSFSEPHAAMPTVHLEKQGNEAVVQNRIWSVEKSHSSHVNHQTDSAPTEPDLQLTNTKGPILFEEYIKEISSTTFQFNIDQMKNHDDANKYYNEIIVLNSDAESSGGDDESSDNDNVIDVDNSHYAYSTKLDDFLISKLKPPKTKEIEEIFINLDDSTDDSDGDDDVIEILVPEAS